jgi:predicted nucleotidyltransferase
VSDLEALQRVLDATPGVRLAVIFGSRGRNRGRAPRDLDVGVWLDDPAGDRLPALRVALERAAGRPVDLVPLDEAPPLLRFEIARGGRVLVEREPHAWAEFRAHAMIAWWDWALTARTMHAAMVARLEEEARRSPELERADRAARLKPRPTAGHGRNGVRRPRDRQRGPAFTRSRAFADRR